MLEVTPWVTLLFVPNRAVVLEGGGMWYNISKLRHLTIQVAHYRRKPGYAQHRLVCPDDIGWRGQPRCFQQTGLTRGLIGAGSPTPSKTESM